MRLDSTSQDYRDAKNHIYGLAHNVCVDGIEQKRLLACLGKIELTCIESGISGKDTIRALLNPIMDGLIYNNWPWELIKK